MSTNKEPSNWAIGWITFAAMMMVMMGIWWIISGLVAIFNSEFYVVKTRWIFAFDISTWGWIHLLFGVIILLAGFFLFKGAVWTRTVGIVIAVIAGILAFMWLPYYPFWAILFIVISVVIIWALTVHGRDITYIVD